MHLAAGRMIHFARPAIEQRPMVTIDDVKRFAMTLPHMTEGLVGGRVKFLVGRIVYVLSLEMAR
jgi:hypothetical protein